MSPLRALCRTLPDCSVGHAAILVQCHQGSELREHAGNGLVIFTTGDDFGHNSQFSLKNEVWGKDGAECFRDQKAACCKEKAVDCCKPGADCCKEGAACCTQHSSSAKKAGLPVANTQQPALLKAGSVKKRVFSCGIWRNYQFPKERYPQPLRNLHSYARPARRSRLSRPLQ